MTAAIGAVLVALVAVAWLGCAGLLRLRTPLDRLHCATFVNVAGGGLLTLAGFMADGVSGRSLKIALIWAVGMGTGAALSHAAGRALLYRGRFRPVGAKPE